MTKKEEEVRRIKREFGEQYLQTMATGLIEGDENNLPVVLNSISSSYFCTAEYAAEYGATKDEISLLVTYIPAGMEYSNGEPGICSPSELGVNSSLIPDSKTWITFPKSFQGLPVYYLRGSQFFAL